MNPESTATERPRSSTRQILAAVFRTQDQSYRHLSLRSGWLFVPELKSYWDGNRAGRRFSSAFNSV